MHHFKLFFSLVLIFAFSVLATEKPRVTFEELMVSAEENFQNVADARKLADLYDLPHTIYLPGGVFIEAKGIENNQVVYTIITNLQKPFDNGEVAFWEEIEAKYELTNARIHWSNKPTQNPNLGYETTPQDNLIPSFLMIPESSNDAVMTFNYNDGSLINAAFIPGGNPNLSTPIEALFAPDASILVSDQIADNIVRFDSAGTFRDIFFGGNTAILDNCRGIQVRPGTNTVLATIGSGANASAIPEFDLATGNYLGNFIASNTAFMNSPFDIIFRANDCLVSASSSNDITMYDLSGNHIGDFVASISFPEQLYETQSRNILAGGFSSPSGLYIFDADGNQLNYFGTITGMRGVYQLGNGNYLVTNGSGVFVLDQNTGNVISQPVSGVSARFIREFDVATIPVELTFFSATVTGENVKLSWSTATETNNQGFDIERSEDNVSFEKISFVPGFGTTTEPRNYSYTDESVTNGTNYYRLKQIDFDGSINYTDVVEAEVAPPGVFALKQNYPNPFNPTTSIQFSLPVDAHVTIGIYNLVGEKVAEAVNGDFTAGFSKVSFNASQLSSGVYFYRIDANGINGKNFSNIKKMVLLK